MNKTDLIHALRDLADFLKLFDRDNEDWQSRITQIEVMILEIQEAPVIPTAATEADVADFLRRKAASFNIPNLRFSLFDAGDGTISMWAKVYESVSSPGDDPRLANEIVSSLFLTEAEGGKTFAGHAARCAAKLAELAPDKLAARKRDQAAKLIEEAAALEGKPTPTEAIAP